MKINKLKCKSNRGEITGVEWMTLVGIALLVLILLIQPVNESRTYNRLTGAETTWWDALWVELRVQDSPKPPPRYEHPAQKEVAEEDER